MILKKETLRRLINKGYAKYSGGTEIESVVRDNDRFYVAVDRLDKQRVDHYEIDQNRLIANNMEALPQ